MESTAFPILAGAKPPIFKGTAEHWSDWSFKFTSYIGALDETWLEAMATAASHDEQLMLGAMNSANRELSRKLYYVLTLQTEGVATGIIKGVPENNGLEAWRRLWAKFEPIRHTKSANILRNVLTPKFSKKNFLAELQEWENSVGQYNRYNDALPDSMLKAIVQNHLPFHGFRVQLQMSLSPTATFEI